MANPAVPPDRKSFPKRGLIAIGATASGFLIGIFVTLFQVGLSRMKKDLAISGKIALMNVIFVRQKSECVLILSWKGVVFSPFLAEVDISACILFYEDTSLHTQGTKDVKK